MGYPVFDELEAYYQSGVAVIAALNGIGLRQLSIGFGSAGVILERLDQFCASSDGTEAEYIVDVEDYCVTCLAGLAGRAIRAETRRKRVGLCDPAVLELKNVKAVLRCDEREPDRAFAIVFAALGEVDGGNSEGTVYRLYKRALRLLCQPPQTEQLNRLARHLLKVGRMTGDEVAEFLDKDR
jgi:hypothetical protein